jgi:pseudouridine-5'-phosphate glycosidase
LIEDEDDADDSPVYSPPTLSKKKETVLENYACIVETTCRLCQTQTIRVFSMEGVGGLLSSHESSLDQIEGLTTKTRCETTFTCSACHDALKLMTQEDLIALTIKVAKGETIPKRKYS